MIDKERLSTQVLTRSEVEEALGRGPTRREQGPPFVAQRRKACEACGEDACFLKRMLKTKPCAFRARIVRPGMVCPLERWT